MPRIYTFVGAPPGSPYMAAQVLSDEGMPIDFAADHIVYDVPREFSSGTTHALPADPVYGKLWSIKTFFQWSYLAFEYSGGVPTTALWQCERGSSVGGRPPLGTRLRLPELQRSARVLGGLAASNPIRMLARP